MDSTLDDEVAEGRITSLEEQLLNLAHATGISPSGSPTGMKAFPASLAKIHWLADWRYLALVGSALAVFIGGAAWWWLPPDDNAKMGGPSGPSSLAQTPLKNAAPTAVAHSSDLAQQLQPMERDLIALRQAVKQLEGRQEQLVRDTENLASQLKTSRTEMARKNDIIDQIKAAQTRMADESKTITERLNANQEQLTGVIANASEPKVMPEEPKVGLEQPKMNLEQPNVNPEIPMPRPRPSSTVASTRKPVPIPARAHTNQPQPPSWPWSVR